MKTKLFVFLLLFLLSGLQLMAQYRVKSVTSTHRRDNNVDEGSHVLHYDNTGKIISVDARIIWSKGGENEKVDSRTIPVEYGKNTIKIVRDCKHPFVPTLIKLDKQGRIEEIPDMKIKYENDNSIKELRYLDSKYDVLYDEHQRIAAVARDRDKTLSNYLAYYSENGQVKEVTDRENFIYVFSWNNKKLESFSIYKGRDFSSKTVFIYDDNDNITEQIIYSDTENKNITTHYKITYETGSGNDNEIYLKYGNWILGTILNLRTFDTYTPIRY